MLALFSHQRSELNAYASQIEPALLIADRQHALFSGDDFLNTFVAEHSSIRVVQLLNDNGEHNLRDAINHPAEDFTATPSPADEVAYFQLSGGTTGTPKLIHALTMTTTTACVVASRFVSSHNRRATCARSRRLITTP